MDRNEAIEIVKNNWPDGRHQLSEALRTLIPELKESEDERIVRELKEFFSWAVDRGSVTEKQRERSNFWIAWLEKQVERFPTPPVWKFKKDHTPLLRDSLILNKYGCVAKSPSGSIVSDVWVLDFDTLAKLPKEESDKQGSQNLANSEKTCKDEQKSADKGEPKFEIGDWVVYDHRPYQVVELPKEGCINLGLKGNRKIEFAPSPYCRHWTIQDAKDGDVLNSYRVKATIIFKGCNSDGKHINAYCALQKGILIKQEMLWDRDFEPVTKEQRDLLFQKMKEAGYEWDAEKKELKKIEQNPAWSEEEDTLGSQVMCKWNCLKRLATNVGNQMG